MARGFLTGLVHGGILGAVALAGLSLLAPLPVANPALGVASEAVEARDPLSMGLPAGSEFGRGGDIAPRLPAPRSAAPREARDPVAVPAPRIEPAPLTIRDANLRPEIAAEGQGPAPTPPGEAEGAAGLTLPGLASATRREEVQAAPLPDPGPGRDALPRIAVDSATPEHAPERRNDPQPTTPAPQTSTPGLPAPALDLSLPPDLTDLRRLERN
ncbi:hypothetical protein FA743_01215 [Paracoccus gahaiensis]|uniref:Uncharacterized protein n=1 Tax=Paracoccus gahaiensis TaxID=1706839 RepID=A0A4U0RF36_9RHOB|nr:hypothetical protein [Paracoccus gahaiensis]TJZ93925.1 hypothetical protein FA743_01215 [Paracoccus gahaiensis]